MRIPLSFVLARPLAARRARQPVRRPPRFPRHLDATLGRTSLHRPAPSRSPESSVAISTRARRGSRCHPRPLATSPMYRYDLDASSLSVGSLLIELDRETSDLRRCAPAE